MASLCARVSDGTHQPPPFTESGIPFLFVRHIVGGMIRFDDTKFISSETYDELHTRKPISVGDVLYSAVGSYGVAVEVDTRERFSFQRHIAHLVPSNDKVISRYLVHYLNSPEGRAQAHRAARGVAQKTVTLGSLAQFLIPIPPLARQKAIVEFIDERLTATEATLAGIRSGLKRANRLRQAILKRAFEGRLVPQDPNDEPAEILLARARTNGQSRLGRRAAVERE